MKIWQRADFYGWIALAWLACLAANLLAINGWDARVFILERPAVSPAGQTWNIGYDGQWYHAIAVDPAGAHSRLDMPNYRYQRIVYPMLARLLALGKPEIIPWTMLLLNLLGAAWTVYILARTFVHRGLFPGLALIYVFFLGTLLVVRMDLLEVLAVALGLSGWWLFGHRRHLNLVLFALAGLTKEIALVFPLALAAHLFIHRDWKRGLLVAGSSLAAYALWYVALGAWFGFETQDLLKHSPEWLPFSGLRFLQDTASLLVVWLWVALPALAGLLWLAVRQIRAKVLGWNADLMLLLVSVLAVTTLPRYTWEDPLAMLRAACVMLVALMLAWSHSSPRSLKYLAAWMTPSVLLIFIMPGLFRG